MTRTHTMVVACAVCAVGTHAQAMPQTMTLSMTQPLVAGGPVSITVTDAAPSASLTLLQSDGEIGPGICHPALSGECLDITAGPSGYQVVSLPLDADAQGVATWAGTFPAGVPDGLEWALQAVDLAVAEGTNPIERQTWRDGDGDGCRDTIDPSPSVASPDGDGDGYGADCDCDDLDSDRYPGAPVPDRCDFADLDCSGGPNGESVPLVHATVQDAVDAVQDGGIVCVAAGTHVGTVQVGAKSLTIRGEGPGQTILDGGAAGTVISLDAGTSTLADLTIQNGRAASGAGVNALSTVLTVRDVELRDNVCDELGICGGVGLAAQQGSVVLERVDALDNLATSANASVIGGGIYLYGGVNQLTDLTIRGNVANGSAYGAGLYVAAGTFAMQDVQIDQNIATDDAISYGVGVHVDGATVSMDRVDVRANQAFGLGDAWGAGIYAAASVLDLTNVVVAGNVAWNGGSCVGVGLATGNSTVTATNVTVTGNGAVAGVVNSGLGWYSFADALVLTNTSIDQNLSFDGSGGGIHVLGPLSLDPTYTNVSGNSGGDWLGVPDPTGVDGNISANPVYVSYGADAMTWDLHPGPGSPHVDAGDPLLLDPDLSRSDIGAYGGPGGGW